MKKNLFLLVILIGIVSCTTQSEDNKMNKAQETVNINNLLNQWHLAAAETDSQIFFGTMDSVAVYIGTDATERWSKEEFKKFALPYFEKGKAWNFKPIERKVYFSESGKTAWFDETLNTWMGVCRSSGVLEFKSNEWKIMHYHLSVTVPNEKIKKVIEIIENKEVE